MRQVLVLGAALVLLCGCPAKTQPGGPSGSGGSGGTAGVGISGSGALGGTGGTAGVGISGSGAFGGSAGSGGTAGVGISGTGGDDCGGDAYPSQPRQLDIYVVMDKSYSMIFPVDLWGPTTTALNQFFMSPQAAGIGVGITYFANVCEAVSYETPEVAISPLPGNANALQTSMAGQTPVLGTATTPALTGALNHLRARQTAMPDTKQVLLLVTDGEPASCGATIDNAAMAASDGYNGTPSIPVYVLGLGNVMNLDRIAQSGGTTQALLADPMNPQGVIDAMNAIRGSALPCDYSIPSVSGTFDPTLVNVRHVVGGNETTVFGVGTEGACDPAMGGWYYDNPSAPSRIYACPATCAAFGNGGEVRVVVGCPTQEPPE